MAEKLIFECSHRSIVLLYHIASTLNAVNDKNQTVHDLLILLKQHFSAAAGSIQLITDEGLMDLISCYGFTEEQANSIQYAPIDGQLFTFETEITDDVHIRNNNLGFPNLPPKKICIPVRYKLQPLGVITLFMENDVAITEEQAYVLLSVGAHLGEFIERCRIEEKNCQQLIKKERNIIANELHDSLAQTLASLRFQVRVLDQSLQPVGDFMAFKTIESIENALDEASADLRELIAYCRVPIEQQGLFPAIKRAVEKFRKETDIHIKLQCNDESLILPSNMELNAYRIVQEALTNIKKHANAKTVRVLITHDGHHNVRILIENDGKGFDQRKIDSSDGRHLGLTIMKERARHIGGELKIETDPDEGTRVELKFHPQDQDTPGNS
jgi:two-component system nitrate/nitrite sensor histidine kinase NarX